MCVSLASSRVLQVNGDPVDGKQHGDVVEAIRSGGEKTALLVVDPETDAFFKRCQVTPTEEHLTGETCSQALTSMTELRPEF